MPVVCDDCTSTVFVVCNVSRCEGGMVLGFCSLLVLLLSVNGVAFFFAFIVVIHVDGMPIYIVFSV